MSKFIVLNLVGSDNKVALRKKHIKRFYGVTSSDTQQTSVDTGDYTWSVKETVPEIHKLLYKKGKKW